MEILSLVCHFGCLQLARFEIVIPLKPPFADVQGAPLPAAQRLLPPPPHAFPTDAQHAQRSCQTGKQVLHRRICGRRPFARLLYQSPLSCANTIDAVALGAGLSECECGAPLRINRRGSSTSLTDEGRRVSNNLNKPRGQEGMKK